MKALIKICSVGVVFAGVIASSGEAFAQLPDIFKTTTTSPTGVSTTRYSVKGAPRTQIEIQFTGGSVTRNQTVRTNACGFAVLPNSSRFSGKSLLPKIPEASAFSVQSLLAATPIAVPECLPNGATSFPFPVTVDQVTGVQLQGVAFNAGSGNIVIKTLPANRVIDLEYSDTQDVKRFATTNACGIASFTAPTGAANISVAQAAPVQLSSLSQYRSSCNPDGTLLAEGDNINSVLPNLFTDPTGKTISIGNAVANQQYQILFPNSPNIRSVTSDRCGGITLGSAASPVTGTILVDGVSFDTSTLSTGLKPTCALVNGSYAYNAPANNVKLSNGQIFLKNIPSLTISDRQILQVAIPGNRSALIRANACGFATYRSTTLTSVTPFTIGNQSFTVADIQPITTPRCVNGNLFVGQ